LRETADHADILGKTRSSEAFTADISGVVMSEHGHFSMEICGSKAWLTLSRNHPYDFQAGDIKLTSKIPRYPTAPRSAAG
jgi:hypothetical protein